MKPAKYFMRTSPEMAVPWEDLAGRGPFSLAKDEKRNLYRSALSELTRNHYQQCPPYRLILEAQGLAPRPGIEPEDQPMLPARLFKELELVSVPRENVTRVMTSSGTSGQAVSRIFLDKDNALRQSQVLARIICSFIGRGRLPLLLMDTESVRRDPALFSARGAGLFGFLPFGTEVCYALDEDMSLNRPRLRAFLEKHGTVLMFGYTAIIWRHVFQEMEAAGEAVDLKDGILFHSGGWKKMKDQAVDAAIYNETARRLFGRVRVHNYYGLAEQPGSVFVECEKGHMHCSIYSEALVRRPLDFAPAGFGERGVLELMSLIPTSYPGHILLTEDEGEILGEDDCPCGRLGRYFKIHGRIRGAEPRGCSDTYERP
jgi:hypothetical protein